MTVHDIQRLYDYSYWANRRLFEVVSQLRPDEFCRDVAGAYGSVRNTLVHVLSAEWGWLERCGGLPRGPKLDPANYKTPDVLIAEWALVERAFRAFLEKLTESDLERVVEFSFGGEVKHRRTVAHLLWHATSHAVHHRGQVVILLRLLERPAGSFDVLFFDADEDE
jgi:uncharacterized damage-inducible protein DinB